MGTISVTLGRYLHFDAELYFHAPLLGAVPTPAVLRGDGGQALPAPDRNGTPGYMALTESRRMRSGELHYLDHPKLGVVVRIDPVEIPQALVEAFEDLEEPVE